MLSARPAEAVEREASGVMTARDRHRADGMRHIGDRDRDEALGRFLGAHRAAGGVLDFAQHLVHSRQGGVSIERLVGIGAECRGKSVGLELAEDQVAIGHRQRPALPITRRAGLGAGALRADGKARAVEPADRAAASGDGVDAHHRCPDSHPGDAVLAVALVFAGVERDVGRSAAHVEADHALEPGAAAGLRHADDPARGAGQDRILAAKRDRRGKAAIRLHEQRVLPLAQHTGEARDIAFEHGRKIGVGAGRIGAPNQPGERR